MKRINKITKYYNIFSGWQYKIQLEPNYWFDFSGCDVTICNSVNQIYEATKHIVFCDGT